MDLKSINGGGENFTAGQQAAFYHMRKRRVARERAGAAEFKAQDTLGLVLVVAVETE